MMFSDSFEQIIKRMEEAHNFYKSYKVTFEQAQNILKGCSRELTDLIIKEINESTTDAVTYLATIKRMINVGADMEKKYPSTMPENLIPDVLLSINNDIMKQALGILKIRPAVEESIKGK
jgi:hypothetical protein